jgi:hypothetical protein
MKYKLNAISSGSEETYVLKGFDLAKSIVPILSGILDNILINVGKKLNRIKGYSELSDVSKQFVNEIIFTLMLEQLSNLFQNKVMLAPGEQHAAQYSAMKQISDCSTFVKVLNKVSLDDIRNAIIAQTEKEAKKIILDQLNDSENNISTPLNWQDMQISDPFKKDK